MDPEVLIPSLSHSLFSVCFFRFHFLPKNSSSFLFWCSFHFYFMSMQFFLCLIGSEALDPGLDFSQIRPQSLGLHRSTDATCHPTIAPPVNTPPGTPGFQIWALLVHPAAAQNLARVHISRCTCSTCMYKSPD